MSFNVKNVDIEDAKSSDTTPLLDDSGNAAKFGIFAILKSILLFTVHPPYTVQKN